MDSLRASTLFLNNPTAFDAAGFCRNHEDERTFVGIEVEHHENLRGSSARHP